MLSKDFIPGYVGFIKSLLANNPWFDLPIVIMDIDLTSEDKALCNSYYDNIFYKKLLKENYEGVNWRKTKPWLWNTYYTLDIFSYHEYNRLVFIDTDTLVLGDIKYLFEIELKNAVGGVQCYQYSRDNLTNNINAGVIVLNLNKLKGVYSEIVEFSKQGFPYPEQDAINLYFKNQIDFLHKVYNVEKRMLFSSNYPFDIDKIKILHFVSLKPWQQRVNKRLLLKEREDYKELEKVWWEYYND